MHAYGPIKPVHLMMCLVSTRPITSQSYLKAIHLGCVLLLTNQIGAS
jgi:hypothetical protein